MDDDVRSFIAQVLGAARVERVERIQSLWGGYGELVRAHLAGAPMETVIVKSVSPPPRAHEDDISHARKCRSYDAELAFYRTFAARCDESCRVAKLLGHRRAPGQWLLVLEDLDAAGFGARQHDPRGRELDACLDWLASFHARFIGVAPEGLWSIGTYWHLDTRRNELAAIRDVALRDRAPELDRLLRAARFRTIVHGDAKPDNFCFSGASVAAVDFQYVGGGPGIRDIAYLLYGTRSHEPGLTHYFSALRTKLDAAIDANALETEWRALYPVAVDDFRRFLAGWKKVPFGA